MVVSQPSEHKTVAVRPILNAYALTSCLQKAHSSSYSFPHGPEKGDATAAATATATAVHSILRDCVALCYAYICALQDPRVDVCVYFISPHRLKQMDVEFMKRLSLVSLCFHNLLLQYPSPASSPPPLPNPPFPTPPSNPLEDSMYTCALLCLLEQHTWCWHMYVLTCSWHRCTNCLWPPFIYLHVSSLLSVVEAFCNAPAALVLHSGLSQVTAVPHWATCTHQ